MKTLIIPDVHLKPWMFDKAEKLMTDNNISVAVFLGDLVDEFNQENNINLYKETIDRAIKFKHDFPNSLFCWGNHDISYLADWSCSGNSDMYNKEIANMIINYQNEVNPKIIQYIDNFIFSHAGIESYSANYFEHISNESFSIKKLADIYNNLNYEALGDYSSPIWLRPQYSNYYTRFTQIIGHTPTQQPIYRQNTWILDTFSLSSDKTTPFGNETFVIIDTENYILYMYQYKNYPQLMDKVDRINWNKYLG